MSPAENRASCAAEQAGRFRRFRARVAARGVDLSLVDRGAAIHRRTIDRLPDPWWEGWRNDPPHQKRLLAEILAGPDGEEWARLDREIEMQATIGRKGAALLARDPGESPTCAYCASRPAAEHAGICARCAAEVFGIELDGAACSRSSDPTTARA